MSESPFEIVCGRCKVKISGPNQSICEKAFTGHEKEVHNYMTGQEWYERFEKELSGYLPSTTQNSLYNTIIELARKASKLEEHL